MKRIFLHCCCAPCAATALERFRASGDVVHCYYYNPNIKPFDEYVKRGEQLKKLCNHFGVSLTLADYDFEVFDEATINLKDQPEGGFRCSVCIGLRLRRAALKAKMAGYDYFCTTLSTSARKNTALINMLGQSAAIDNDVEFLAFDFKKQNGNLISKKICNELGLYRQNYCGCTPRL